jgi:hypothetical protein
MTSMPLFQWGAEVEDPPELHQLHHLLLLLSMVVYKYFNKALPKPYQTKEPQEEGMEESKDEEEEEGGHYI